MTEKPFRFSAAAIDELNRHPGAQRPTAKQFALLMLGLAGVLLLFLIPIVW